MNHPNQPQAPLARRSFLRGGLLGIAAVSLGTPVLTACSPQPGTAGGTTSPTPGKQERLILGGYGSGMQSFSYDPPSASLTKLAGLSEMNPSLFAWDHVNGLLVAKCEDEKREKGYVATYKVLDDGKFKKISSRVVGDPSYVTVSPSGRHVVATDWKNGTVVSIPLGSDGTLGEVASTVQHTGSGPYELQTGPHAHSAVFDRKGARFICCDAGNDMVYVYELDDKTGAITETPSASIKLPPGTCPRHAVFNPNKDLIYVDGESSMKTMTLSYDQSTGQLKLLQTVSTLAQDQEALIPKQWWGSADIKISSDGRFVYVTNRGPDTIVAFSTDEKDGLLKRVQIIPSGGKTPRSLEFSPDGSHLLCANQNSGAVNRFDVGSDGQLEDKGVVAALNGVAGFMFVPST